MNESEFNREFKKLTGHPALRWQRRLFTQHFSDGNLCDVIDLPTGLGKTMVMAIWLIARETNRSLPRRLVYVVDRRTVVDQATDLAVKLQQAIGDSRLAISTLRGQLADNRKWSEDLSRPAIVIGTVDLIGSALLFSGYRSSFRRRPLEAGLLGQDSLLVLDEAHLSKPFEKLIKSIASFQQGQGLPMHVIRMSATSGESNGERVFSLDPVLDLTPGDETSVRYNATKRLRVSSGVEKKKLNEALRDRAIELARDAKLRGKRIVVFVRAPEDARIIADMIRDQQLKPEDAGNKAKAAKLKPYAESVAVLTGTMRGWERDKVVEKKKDEAVNPQNQVMQRFLDGEIDPSDEDNQHPAFLVSTSAGEVGFDLNADHMVCDAAPLDSMIQRLGRVNRRGKGDAVVWLVRSNEPAKSDIESACEAAAELFIDGMDVSPQALAELRSNLSADRLKSVLSPEAVTVELTDILLDAWSMTSIAEPMPGRPEVAPWLRGIAVESPQTTIAWRAELDLFTDDEDLDVLHVTKALTAIFAKHRIRPHESLTTGSHRVASFLKAATHPKKGRPELRSAHVALKLSRELTVTTIGELIDNPSVLNADPTLILPASFGGIEKGMLSSAALTPLFESRDVAFPSLDVADEAGYEAREDAQARMRVIIERSDGAWEPSMFPGKGHFPEALGIEPRYEKCTDLFNAFKKGGLRVRLVQPVSFDDEGSPIKSLVVLSPVGSKTKRGQQTLVEHVGYVEAEAQRIASELGLGDPFKSALLFAAKWHDEGKKADVWQRFIGGPIDGELLGKAATMRDPKVLHGYRHEFGSLLRVRVPELLADEQSRDLALHLIAVHHGFGRPHFERPFDRESNTAECERTHADAIRRFARLQRKYGWWQLAWLENLLRSADALASADDEAEDDTVAKLSDEVGGAE